MHLPRYSTDSFDSEASLLSEKADRPQRRGYRLDWRGGASDSGSRTSTVVTLTIWAALLGLAILWSLTFLLPTKPSGLAKGLLASSGRLGKPVETFDFPQAPVLLDAPHIVAAADGNQYTGFYSEEDLLIEFLSIPFADAPSGPLRFRAPRPFTGRDHLEVPRDVSNYPSSCVVGWGGVEDCLHLNVVIPSYIKVGQPLLPVMLLIHGGGFVSGTSSEGWNLGNELVLRSMARDQSIIFVSFNYRLGALGFMASPLAEDGSASEDLDLNAGFLDQVMAMQWVNENIARWGGDPHKVTLFGNSAGSVSIGLHLLYTPQHLYRAAFLISGSPTSFPVPTAAAGTTRTLDRMLPKYCDRPAPSTSAKDYTKFIDCLRSLSIIELIESSGPLLENLMVDAHFPFYPILEGQDGWLNAMPSEKMERGEMSRVPIVAGTVRDEGTGFVRGETSSVEAVGWILQGLFSFNLAPFNTLLPSLLERYSADTTTLNYYQLASKIVGDLIWQAPKRYLLDSREKAYLARQTLDGDNSVEGEGTRQWAYLYDDLDPDASPSMGVYHGSDVTLWMGQMSWEGHLYSPHRRDRSSELGSLLINFIVHLDPNDPVLLSSDGESSTPAWPVYNSKTRVQLHVTRDPVSTTMVDREDEETMDFLNSHHRELSN